MATEERKPRAGSRGAGPELQKCRRQLWLGGPWPALGGHHQKFYPREKGPAQTADEIVWATYQASFSLQPQAAPSSSPPPLLSLPA